MALEIKINETPCRYYYEGKFWVLRDGKKAFINADNSNIEELNIMIKADGERFVTVDGRDFLLKIAIRKCFCHWPKDGKLYEVKYKDGNISNLDYTNLQLKEIVPYTPPSLPPTPTFTTKPRVKLKNGLTVTRDGRVYNGKSQLTIVDYAYDPDTDKHFYFGPYVHVGNNRFRVDDLMGEAGYVQGNMRKLVNPKVCHKDLNFDNFNSDNLEWISTIDPHYSTYDAAKQAHKKKREIDFDSGNF